MGLLPVSAADYVDLVPKYEPIDVLSRARWCKSNYFNKKFLLFQINSLVFTLWYKWSIELNKKKL